VRDTVNTVIPQDQQALREDLGQARERLDALTQELRGVDGELEALSKEQRHHELLSSACDALDQLSELGGTGLFWGEHVDASLRDSLMARARRQLQAFQARLDEIAGRRQAVVEKIGLEAEGIEVLEEDLFDAQEQEERRKLEWIVEREISALPARMAVMPWSRGGEDDKRFRKSLLASLLVGLLLGLILPQIDLPLPEPWDVVEVPERLAQLVREQRPLPPPPPVVEEKKPEEPQTEPEPKPLEEPVTPTDQPVLAQGPEPDPSPKMTKEEKPATKGILAFREKFSNMSASKPSAKLGADARISAASAATPGRPERNMVTTQAPGSSGGINLSSLSRDIGGGGGGGGAMAGVQLTRVASSIGPGGGEDRPLAAGHGAGRTDEEIQIVFDRHKAALYRLYNRELRKDPTLKGQMILRLRIEPDGSVSLCQLEASDMDAPQLSSQVLDRVLTFDFGAKDVPAITILYPIDFLPAV
jgi:hypothetical protein